MQLENVVPGRFMSEVTWKSYREVKHLELRGKKKKKKLIFCIALVTATSYKARQGSSKTQYS